jgi:SAM-dependent methyltransferase
MHARVHQEHEDRDHWWFRARREIFAAVIDRLIVLPGTARIADLGPGGGVNMDTLERLGRVVAVDLDAGSARRARAAGADAVRADATRPPLREGGIDLLCALDVLEHLDQDGEALERWASLLGPDGRLLLSVPALDLLWGRQDVLAQHRRRYSKGQLRALLEASGFVVERLSYFNSLLFLPILLVRLLMRPWANASGGEKSDLGLRLPAPVEQLLFRAFASEARWLVTRDLPIGVSLLAIARRRTNGGDR